MPEPPTPPDWKNAIDQMRPFITRINTPSSAGTGFLFAKTQNLCGVATAAHVVNYAHWWELPIRLEHYDSQRSIVLRHGERAILLEEALDSAAIVFPKESLPFPDEVPSLIEEEAFLRVGNPIGWLGFPAISSQNLCFFLGTASCWVQQEHSYLVDGVAINGVSGGPAFWAVGQEPVVVGAVSAYIPNRATGDVLPGLSVVRDMKHVQAVVQQLRSLAEAKEKEAAATPQEPPPKPIEGEPSP